VKNYMQTTQVDNTILIKVYKKIAVNRLFKIVDFNTWKKRKNDFIAQIDRMPDESDKIFNDRIEFIKRANQDLNDIKESVRLSKVYINYKYKKCKYSQDLFFKIKNYLE